MSINNPCGRNASGRRFRGLNQLGRALLGACATAFLTAGLASHAQAYRVRPALPRPTPLDTHPDSLTLQVSPALVSFDLIPNGTAQGSSGITITATWYTHGSTPSLMLIAYFNTSSSALSDGKSPPDTIPSSAVLGQMPTGLPTSYSPFTQTNAFGGAGASLALLNTTSGLLPGDGSRTDVLNLRIDLSGLPSLPPGTYTGTVTLQASIL